MAEYKHDSVLPNKQSKAGKKEQVATMFDGVAKRYDFLNRFLSLGIDITWRKKAIAFLKPIQPKVVLDVATGTADVALMTHKILATEQIIGIDISDGMLDIGRKKITAEGLDAQIQLYNGDSADIHFDSNSFDAATVSFGVRNFEFLEKGLAEILRVVKPNGRLVILEFSKPKNVFVKTFYNFYMKVISPNIAKLFSKNKEAYQYLDESIQKFPEGKDFVAVMEKVGFRNTIYKPLTFGICSIYCGTK
jgi:demethylmenaquinone methyltransferase / 2-methoxy-6-polyprenyl-1,4-benzoquinol methylase